MNIITNENLENNFNKIIEGDYFIENKEIKMISNLMTMFSNIKEPTNIEKTIFVLRMFSEFKSIETLKNVCNVMIDLGKSKKFYKEKYEEYSEYFDYFLPKIKEILAEYSYLFEGEELTFINNFLKKEIEDSESLAKVQYVLAKYKAKVLSRSVEGLAYDLQVNQQLKDSDKDAELIFAELEEIAETAFLYLKQIMEFKNEKSNKDVLNQSAIENKTTKETILSLQNAIRENIRVGQKAKRFLEKEMKSNVMRNEKIRNMSFDSSNELRFTFEEAVALVKEVFLENNKGMYDCFVELLDSGMVDYKPREDKRSGAFAVNTRELNNKSIIMLNFKGELKDVITLAHEAGHAYHHKVLSKNSVFLNEYPLIFAETASMYAEQMVYNKLTEKYANSSEIKALQYSRIIKIFDLLLMVPSRFDFEENCYNLLNDNELSLENVQEMHLKNQEKWYGKSKGKESNNTWAIVRHYFFIDNSFYNHPYYMGFLINEFLGDNQSEDRMEDFLYKTGYQDANKCFKEAFGKDLESKEFWVSIIDKIDAELDLIIKNF